MTTRADKNQKNVKKFSKSYKFLKSYKKYKFAFLASGCSSVGSHEGWGEGVLRPGLIGGQHWGVGGNSAVGGQNRGVNSGGVSSTSKNGPSHHKYKYKSPKQFELKQS